MRAVRLILPYSAVLLGILAVTTLSIPWQRNAAYLGVSKLFLAGHEPLPAILREQAREYFAVTEDCGITPCVNRRYALERRAALVESIPYLAVRDGRITLDAGVEAQKHGNSDAARQYYESAANTPVRQVQIEASARQAALTRSSESDMVLTGKLTDAATLMPIVSTAGCHAALQPVGIYVDHWDIALDEPVHWTVLWKSVNGQVHLGDETRASVSAPDVVTELITAGSYLIQMGVGESIIRDGGFEELLASRSGPPQALPYALYSAQTPEDTAVESVMNLEGSSMALALKGNDRGLVGLGSAVNTITHSQAPAYLVVGRYRSDHDAKPQLGLRWLANANAASENDQSTYVVTTPSTYWKNFAGILAPPPDITATQMWVINAVEETNVWVDDLAVIEVQLPCTSVPSS